MAVSVACVWPKGLYCTSCSQTPFRSTLTWCVCRPVEERVAVICWMILMRGKTAFFLLSIRCVQDLLPALLQHTQKTQVRSVLLSVSLVRYQFSRKGVRSCQSFGLSVSHTGPAWYINSCWMDFNSTDVHASRVSTVVCSMHTFVTHHFVIEHCHYLAHKSVAVLDMHFFMQVI